jgi:hypothetical protein
MAAALQYETTFTLDGHSHTGQVHIALVPIGDATHYRATLVTAPLKGSYGGVAESIELALDFLNLAMQAEGAAGIHYQPHAQAA